MLAQKKINNFKNLLELRTKRYLASRYFCHKSDKLRKNNELRNLDNLDDLNYFKIQNARGKWKRKVRLYDKGKEV